MVLYEAKFFAYFQLGIENGNNNMGWRVEGFFPWEVVFNVLVHEFGLCCYYAVHNPLNPNYIFLA